MRERSLFWIDILRAKPLELSWRQYCARVFVLIILKRRPHASRSLLAPASTRRRVEEEDVTAVDLIYGSSSLSRRLTYLPTYPP